MRQVHLSKDREFRLHRPENVTAGDWCIVVKCESCQQPIYLLTDPSNGKNPVPFNGEGKLSVPCHSCHHDTTYASSDPFPYQAPHDIQFRRPIPKASGSSRQPLKRKYRNVKVTFGAAFLEDRPEAAAAIGRCVALWTEVEAQQARLLAKLLKANTEPALAMFLALRSGRAQSEVLNAVAGAVLDSDDLELFSAVMRVCSAAEKERNHLAHGRYGGAYAIANGVAWIDPVHLVEHAAMIDARGITKDSEDWVRDRTFVYEPEDIETIAQDIAEAGTLLSLFTGYLEPGWAARGEREARRLQLCSEPRLAREIRQIREGQKRSR